MADFSFVTDSDDERAAEEVLSQAIDHSVLEQATAINCSGFTTDSPLPTHLETRFRKLKSFPITNPKSPYLTTTLKNSNSSRFNSQSPPTKSLKPQIDDEHVFGSPSNDDPFNKKRLKPKSQSEFCSSPSKGSDSSTEFAISAPYKQEPDEKMVLKSKFWEKSFRSPLNSWSSSMKSLSPPKKTTCFWCSRIKFSRKKCEENGVSRIGPDWGKDDRFFSELRTFSAKEQKNFLKKAMKEEEKINREADKIVKWAKQASARMDVSGLEDELSDDDNTK